VTTSLEAFDATAAGRRLASLIDDMSNWYVRRSRRRFWSGADGNAAAFATLHTALVTLTQLMAPFTPFLADYLWDVLRPPGAPSSVHLSSWPRCDPSLVDPELSGQMALARRLVELGRSARAAAGVRTRQPLARALVAASGFGALPEPLRALMAAELNVHEVAALDSGSGELVRYEVKPQFRSLGQRFGASTQAVAAAIGTVDPVVFARAFAVGDGEHASPAGSARVSAPVSVEVPTLGTVSLGPDDIVVTQTPLSGWEVASAGGETVALDLSLTPALRAEGLAREVIRLIQDARKNAGLDVTDRIALRWTATDPELGAALTGHRELVSDEVLAVSFGSDADDVSAPAVEGPWHEHGDDRLGLRFRFAKSRPK
jgi:isoleucyl-tRNA synthetase